METETLIQRITSGACAAAQELFGLKKKEIKRYTRLAFALAAAVVLVAIVVIALLVSKEWALAVISALGAVVGGAAWIAIFKIRSDAIKDAKDFLAKIGKYCGEDVAEEHSL